MPAGQDDCDKTGPDGTGMRTDAGGPGKVGEAGTSASAGFAAQAARLLACARANERAVRSLEEASQILAEGVDELAHAQELAEALEGLSDQVELVRAAAREVRGASAAAEEFARMRDVAERAIGHMSSIEEALAGVAERAAALDERLSRLDGRLSQALDRVEGAGLDATLERIEALEDKMDRVLELLGSHADAYAERVEPQVARLEEVAERMDAPAVADELADVLATNYQLFEAIDAMRSENADAQAYWDGVIEKWHRRHGGQ